MLHEQLLLCVSLRSSLRCSKLVPNSSNVIKITSFARRSSQGSQATVPDSHAQGVQGAAQGRKEVEEEESCARQETFEARLGGGTRVRPPPPSEVGLSFHSQQHHPPCLRRGVAEAPSVAVETSRRRGFRGA